MAQILDDYVTYSFGSFSLNFKEVPNLQDVSSAVVHVGITFGSRSEVDHWHSKIRLSGCIQRPGEIIGGIGQGPYRFYVKDPNGYTLEFETWEDSSD